MGFAGRGFGFWPPLLVLGGGVTNGGLIE